MRRLLGFVLAIALVAGQWAGQMHALSHAKQDLTAALTVNSATAAGDWQSAPNQDHSPDRCIAFQAIDSAAVTPTAPAPAILTPCSSFVLQHIVLLPAESAHYHSRAPPALS